MNKLVVLSGVPGSGKSYLSNTLKKLMNSHIYVISSDALRILITGNPQDLSKDDFMWDIYYQMASLFAKDPDGVVVLDSTNYSCEKRIAKTKALKPLFNETILVSFDIDKSIVMNQNLQREHPLPPAILEEYIKIFELPQEKDKEHFDEIVVIHSNDMSEAITKILGNRQAQIA